MASEVLIRLVLVDHLPGVDFGIQRGKGWAYQTLFVQRSSGGDLVFDFSLPLAEGKDQPDFRGPFAQGTPTGRFVYIDVGTYAGQKNTPWSRRMKVPLGGITRTMIGEVMKRPGLRLEARIPGTGKDGGPNCATVRPLGNWTVTK